MPQIPYLSALTVACVAIAAASWCVRVIVNDKVTAALNSWTRPPASPLFHWSLLNTAVVALISSLAAVVWGTLVARLIVLVDQTPSGIVRHLTFWLALLAALWMVGSLVHFLADPVMFYLRSRQSTRVELAVREIIHSRRDAAVDILANALRPGARQRDVVAHTVARSSYRNLIDALARTYAHDPEMHAALIEHVRPRDVRDIPALLASCNEKAVTALIKIIQEDPKGVAPELLQEILAKIKREGFFEIHRVDYGWVNPTPDWDVYLGAEDKKVPVDCRELEKVVRDALRSQRADMPNAR